MNWQNNNSEKLSNLGSTRIVTFIMASFLCGDGKDPSTMDFLSPGFRLPQVSLLIETLTSMGIKSQAISWENQQFDWADPNYLLIFGPVWDYHEKSEAFLKFIDFMVERKIFAINHPEFIKWNTNKKYLLDLSQNKISIPRTMIFGPESKKNLKEAIKQYAEVHKSTNVIIKGVIDANGIGFRKLNQANKQANVKHFEDLKANHQGAILQQFLPQISTKSELSFVTLNGQISHIFIKVASKSDLRIHGQYGGKSFHVKRDLSDAALKIEQIKSSFRDDFSLTVQQLKMADTKVKELPLKLATIFAKLGIPAPVYLRIDIAVVMNDIVIIELEGIQPHLEMPAAMLNDPSHDVVREYVNQVILPYL